MAMVGSEDKAASEVTPPAAEESAVEGAGIGFISGVKDDEAELEDEGEGKLDEGKLEDEGEGEGEGEGEEVEDPGNSDKEAISSLVLKKEQDERPTTKKKKINRKIIRAVYLRSLSLQKVFGLIFKKLDFSKNLF
jgi:hypothetical protein